MLAGRVLWKSIVRRGDCGKCKCCSGVVVVSKGSAAWKTWRADDDDATFWATKMSLEAKVREKMFRADALWQVCGVLREKYFLSVVLFFSVGMFQLG